MKVDIEMKQVAADIGERIEGSDVAENVGRLLGAVGQMVERSVDVGLRLAEQVSEDGTQIATEGMALGHALKREVFEVARTVTKDLSEVLGSTHHE